MLTYRQIYKIFFAYKLSYEKQKSVKHRVIGSYSRNTPYLSIFSPNMGKYGPE